MANYYTQFSLTVPLRNAKEEAWVRERIAGGITLKPHDALKDVEGDDRLCFDAEIEKCSTEPDKSALWIYSEEGGSVDDVVAFLREFLKANRPDREYISFEWAHSCSKPREDGFGGGASVVTADRDYFVSTGDWMLRMRVRLDRRWKAKKTTKRRKA